MSGEPYTKAQQLARPVRRYRRKVAGPKRWNMLLRQQLADLNIRLEEALQNG